MRKINSSKLFFNASKSRFTKLGYIQIKSRYIRKEVKVELANQININDSFKPLSSIPTSSKNVKSFSPTSSNCMHDNSHMTDTSLEEGPIPNSQDTTATIESVFFRKRIDAFRPSLCPTFVIDKDGYLVTVCFKSELFNKDKDKGKLEIYLLLVDLNTMKIVDGMEIPDRDMNFIKLLKREERKTEFRKTHGGAYFFINSNNEAVIPCANNEIWIVPIVNGKFKKKANDYQRLKTGVFSGEKDRNKLVAVVSDSHERLWYTSREMNIGVFIKEASGYKKNVLIDRDQLGFDENEEIQNSSSVDDDGVYIVTNKRVMQVNLVNNKIVVKWNQEYGNNWNEDNKIPKAGHLFNGAGTTPTVLDGGGVVAICNNNNKLGVELFHTLPKPDGEQRISALTLFNGINNSACENSVITHGDFLVVGNTYGYIDPTKDSFPGQENKTQGGLQKLRFQGDNRDKLDGDEWFRADFDIKSATPKLSSSTGVLYCYVPEVVKDLDETLVTIVPDNVAEERAQQVVLWKLVGIDYRTGGTLFEIPVGLKRAFNNLQSTFIIGPNNSLVVANHLGFTKISTSLQ